MPSRIVISDASPLNYLILIEHADILPVLYTEVLIPESVAEELRHAAAPEAVRTWVDKPPSWLRIRAPVGDPAPLPLQDLDRGERDAILLAVHLRADLLLIDERDGVEAARNLGLTTTGTLGVLVRAAERGVIDLAAAISRLRETNFRVDPVLLERLSANVRQP
jgi:predicted nucleic acid-binding protein